MRSLALFLLLLGLALPSSGQVAAWSTKVGQHTDESGGAISAWPNLFAGFTSAGTMTLSRLNAVTGDLVWRSVAEPGTVMAVVQESVQRVHLFGTTPAGRAQMHTFNANNGSALNTLDLGDFRIEWVRRFDVTPTVLVFGKKDNSSVLLSLDMPSRSVNWSRMAPMLAASNTYDGLFTLEPDGPGYLLHKLRTDTGAVDRSMPVSGVSGFLSRVREIRFNPTMSGLRDYAQIVFVGDAPGGRGRLVSCWANPYWQATQWQYTDLSCPGYLARLGYVNESIGLREETASGSQSSSAYELNPYAALGTGTRRTPLGSYLHESGLQSVYLAGSGRDISLWRRNLGMVLSSLGVIESGPPIGLDGGRSVDDVPIAESMGGMGADRFVLFEARDQAQSSVYVMRTQSVSAEFGYVTGGNTANLTVSLSAPAVRPLTINVTAVEGQPVGLGTQSITFGVGEQRKTLQLPTRPVSGKQLAYIELSYNKVRQRVYGEIRRAKLSVLTVTPNYGRGGDVLTGTVYLGGQAPAGGMPVQVSDSSGLVGTPASVTVPHGASETTFPITLFAPVATIIVTVTAIEDNVTLSKTLTLLRSELNTISLSNAWVKGGTALALTIDLDAPAPAGGLQCSVATEGAVLPRSPVTGRLGSRTAAATLYTSEVTADTPSVVHVSAQGRTRTKAVLVRP